MQDAFVRAFKKRAASGKAMSLVIPLNPVPASRPRVTRWGTYYLKKYTTWMKQAALFLPEEKTSTRLSGPVAVLTELVVKKPRTTKRSYPQGDNDNYEKAVWDSITRCKAVWDDDDQILLNVTVKRYTENNEEPHVRATVIAL